MTKVVDFFACAGRGHLSWRAAFLFVTLAVFATPSALADPLDAAAERYRQYLIKDIGQALAGARTLRERIDAKDVDGAKRAWVDARIGWERSEVFTSGFVPELDQEIDAWPNATHGFHGIEAGLFGPDRADIREETDVLIAHLADLNGQVRDIALSPQRLLNGIARLAFEIGGNKADGGESRLSGTSLNDIQSNADGIEVAYRVIFAGAVEANDPKQAKAAQAVITRLKTTVQISDLRNLDTEKLRADSEELIALLQGVAPTIGLDKPTLEETSQ